MVPNSKVVDGLQGEYATGLWAAAEPGSVGLEPEGAASEPRASIIGAGANPVDGRAAPDADVKVPTTRDRSKDGRGRAAFALTVTR